MTEREIFVAALNENDPNKRRSYLEQACAGDAEVRGRVEALLAAHGGLGSFLEGPAVPRDTDTFEPTPDSPPEETVGVGAGSFVGPYRLLQVIGEGGMGTVWMADQTTPIRRRVAVKVVKAGMDSRQVLARFEAERQALALMEHPNIARVLDAGSTSDGRPYFVMELVRGVPLTKFCDDQQLEVPERLRVFQQVCSAMQHAHQKGVIHRDLKPTNVLVENHEGRPVPKVIDFGLAKAVGAAALTDRSLFTHFGTVLGTPLYMAPEQAEVGAFDVDTRADVYALGVLLYELLTGTTPIEHDRLVRAAWDEIRRVIKEEEPQKPSARLSSSEDRASIAALRQTEPNKLVVFVRSDLDWVVMKALAKERDQRYESASAFAADIERFLTHEPVAARPPTMRYKLRKFARRNKTTLVVAGLVLFFLGLMGSGIGWAVRDRSALAAEADRDRTARQAATEQEARLAIEEAVGLLRQRRYEDALSAARRAEGILAGGGGESIRDRALELQKDVRMAVLLDSIRSNDGSPRQPSEWVGGGVRRLDGSYLPGGDGGNRDRDQQYAQAFREYGIDVDRLEPHQVAEQVTARSIPSELIGALDHWASERKGMQKVPDAGWKRLIAAARAADPDEWRNRVRDALEQNKVETLKKLAASPIVRSLPLTTLDLIGTALQHWGVAETVTFLRTVQLQYPGDFWINFKLAWVLEHQSHSRWEEALRFYTVALSIRPGNTGVLARITRVFYKTGRFEEAIACYRRAVELDSGDAELHNELGECLDEQDRADEAIACFEKAIQLAPRYALPHKNLGYALIDFGKHDEGIASIRKAVQLDPNNSYAHQCIALALLDLGKHGEAIGCMERAIQLDPKNAYNRNTLGSTLTRMGKLNEAIACLKKAIDLDPTNIDAHSLLGDALRQQQKLDEATLCYKKHLELAPAKAEGHISLGDLLHQKNQLDEAIACYTKAIALHPKSIWGLIKLGDALHQKGKSEEARVHHAAAIACLEATITPAVKHNRDDNEFAMTLVPRANGRLRDPARAVVLAQLAVKLDPNNSCFLRILGVAYYQSGDQKSAIATLERPMEPRQGNDPIREFYLAMAYQQRGEKEKARVLYDQAVRGMDTNPRNSLELRSIREQAAVVLGLVAKARATTSP